MCLRGRDIRPTQVFVTYVACRSFASVCNVFVSFYFLILVVTSRRYVVTKFNEPRRFKAIYWPVSMCGVCGLADKIPRNLIDLYYLY